MESLPEHRLDPPDDYHWPQCPRLQNMDAICICDLLERDAIEMASIDEWEAKNDK